MSGKRCLHDKKAIAVAVERLGAILQLVSLTFGSRSHNAAVLDYRQQYMTNCTNQYQRTGSAGCEICMTAIILASRDDCHPRHRRQRAHEGRRRQEGNAR